jgi:hypothetical protein
LHVSDFLIDFGIRVNAIQELAHNSKMLTIDIACVLALERTEVDISVSKNWTKGPNNRLSAGLQTSMLTTYGWVMI